MMSIIAISSASCTGLSQIGRRLPAWINQARLVFAAHERGHDVDALAWMHRWDVMVLTSGESRQSPRRSAN